MRDAVVACAVLAAVTIFTQPCWAQSPPSNDPDEARIEDVITASHILTNEGILDSFGHVSARSAKNPDHFFMPRAMPPALVSRADIVEVGLDCKPVDPNAPRLNGERYIHWQEAGLNDHGLECNSGQAKRNDGEIMGVDDGLDVAPRPVHLTMDIALAV